MTRAAALLLAALLALSAPAGEPSATAATTPAGKAKAKRCPKAKPGAKTKTKAKRCRKAKAKQQRAPAPPAEAAPEPQSPGREGGDSPKSTTPGTGSGSGGSAPSGGGSAGGGGGAPAELNAVGVKAYDRSGTFVFETTRSTVRAGELTVSFHNYDLDDHNLWIEGTAPVVLPLRLSDAIGHHGDVTATATLAAGAYRFFCTVPGHGSMSRALTVSG